MSFKFQAKPISPIPTLCSILIFFFFFSTPSSSSSENRTLTAYDVLQQYNFPIGLLPKGAISYELDSSSGKFKANLDGTCEFPIQSYDLKYKSTITGVITRNKISSLKGIQVKVLFLWLNIVEVTRDDEDDELQFSVGIASADFDVSNFYESPKCGCGFDCLSWVGINNHMNKSRDYVLS